MFLDALFFYNFRTRFYIYVSDNIIALTSLHAMFTSLSYFMRNYNIIIIIKL